VRILLDECIDRRLAKEIERHEVVTVDRNLAFQQNIPNFTIAVIVLQAPTNRLKAFGAPIKTALTAVDCPQGEISRVSPSKTFKASATRKHCQSHTSLVTFSQKP